MGADQLTKDMTMQEIAGVGAASPRDYPLHRGEGERRHRDRPVTPSHPAPSVGSRSRSARRGAVGL